MAHLIVRPDKNEFLLYAMLDVCGMARRGSIDSDVTRRKAYDIFSKYNGPANLPKLAGICQFHHSHYVGYMLTLNEAPDLTEKDGLIVDDHLREDMIIGRPILPYLTDFYKRTNFEEFYEASLPRYKEDCEFLQDIFKRENFLIPAKSSARSE